jgi:hypothetical protein
LTREQGQALLDLPDPAALALPTGCALRRSEAISKKSTFLWPCAQGSLLT